MLTLCIDTAYKYLSLVLIEDDKIIGSISNECFKRQSEEVFVALNELFLKTNINKDDIDSICISGGPGSYTGVRISLTIAKVLSSIGNKKLFKISTLRLYAGGNEKTLVIMDARANRAYVGIYDKDKCLKEDSVININEIDIKDYDVLLDGHLVGLDDKLPNIPECFLNTKYLWQEVKDIDYLKPDYLKESDAYYR